MTFLGGGTSFSFFLLTTEEVKTKSFSSFKQLKLDESTSTTGNWRQFPRPRSTCSSVLSLTLFPPYWLSELLSPFGCCFIWRKNTSRLTSWVPGSVTANQQPDVMEHSNSRNIFFFLPCFLFFFYVFYNFFLNVFVYLYWVSIRGVA